MVNGNTQRRCLSEGLKKVRRKSFTKKQLAQCRTIGKAEGKNAARPGSGGEAGHVRP